MTSSTAEPIRVLVVDDEKEYATLLVERLRRRGFQMRAVFSGADALVAMEEQEADVAIVDLKMPGMDGVETLKALRARWPAVRVIILTGHGLVSAGLEGMMAGAADFLAKPVDLEILRTAIMAAMQTGSDH